MPKDLTDFERVNYLQPLSLSGEIAMHQEEARRAHQPQCGCGLLRRK